MADSDHTEPKLPPELEEYIFSLAADQKLSDAWNFVLVAKRVHYWLIPRIFNIVIFDDDSSSPIRFSLNIFERYAKHVRHLFLAPPELIQHLPLFTNITDLVIWRNDYDPSYLNVLLTLKNLEYLSLAISSSLRAPSPIYFSICTQVTHLDLNSSCNSWSITAVEPYIHFPLLTHLCVLGGASTNVVQLFLDRSRCQKLEVVVLWDSLYEEDGLETVLTPEDEVIDFALKDDRIIPVSVIDAVKDWENGAKGDVDMWKVADREMALRRMGK